MLRLLPACLLVMLVCRSPILAQEIKQPADVMPDGTPSARREVVVPPGPDAMLKTLAQLAKSEEPLVVTFSRKPGQLLLEANYSGLQRLVPKAMDLAIESYLQSESPRPAASVKVMPATVKESAVPKELAKPTVKEPMDRKKPHADASPAKNLVADPSLEESALGADTPVGWQGFFSQPDLAYTSQIVEGGRTGKRSLVIQGDGDFGVASANLVPLDRKKRYVVRGWVKIEGDEMAAADVKFHYHDATGNYLNQTRRGYVMPASKGWQFITVVDETDKMPEATQLGLAVAVTKKGKAQYDDLELLSFDRDKLPKDFDLEYGTMPKLRVLQRRVGTWDVETTIRPCAWMPRGDKRAEVETIEWALGRQFVRTVKLAPGGGEKSMSLMTYDPRTDRYALWFFDSDGFFPRTETLGQWDADKQTLAYQAEADGIKSIFNLRLVGETRMEFDGLWAGKDGKVYMDMRGTCKRREGGVSTRR